MKKRNILTVILMTVFILLLYFFSGTNYSENLDCVPTSLWFFEFSILIYASFVFSKWIANKICNVPTEHTTIYSVVKWTLYTVVSVAVIIGVGCIGKLYGVDIVNVHTWRGSIVVFLIAFMVCFIIDSILPKLIKK